MMRRPFSIPRLVFLAVLAGRWAVAQTIDPAVVDRVVEGSMKAWQAPGVALAIVQGDRVVVLKGYGRRSLDGDKPVTPDTLFAIASTTKAFTTASVSILADEGKLAWDDPVRRHLDWFRLSDPLASEGVTLRDIVSHRTGLQRHDELWIGSPWTRRQIIQKAGQVALNKPFRSAYQYQNIMFTTAGEVVAAVSGMPWEDFVRKRIFEPLGMKNACFRVAEALQVEDHSAAHEKEKDGAVKVSSWREVDNVGSAGNINAGARDMAQWVRLQLGRGQVDGKRIFSEAMSREMHTPQTVIRLEGITRQMNPETKFSAYGLGWTLSDYRGQMVVSHGGSLRGFRANVALLPEKNIGMAILSNLGGVNMVDAIRNKLVDAMLGFEARDWDGLFQEVARKSEAEEQKRKDERAARRRKDTNPSLELAAYAGRYVHPAYDVCEIGVDGEDPSRLRIAWSNWRHPLRHHHFDTFEVASPGVMENETVQFLMSAEGAVIGLRLYGQQFTRVNPKL